MKGHDVRLKHLIIIFTFFVNCGGVSSIEIAESQPPLEDVLTLELSFGDKDLPDEYLLANPSNIGLAVNSRDEILVVDEDYVKVYDSNGKGKTRFGGNGNGPGEFNSVRNIWLSPDDYITVFGDPSGYMAHYFRPDFSYIDRVNYRIVRPYKQIMDINDLNAQRPEIVFNISETERVYTIESVDKDRNIRDHREIFLFYDSPDTLITLARYNQSNFISGPGGMIRIMSILGRLHVELLPERRLVYVHSYHDSEINVSEALYTLTILSLDTFQKTFITHPFTPFAFEWEPMVFPDDYIESNPDRYKRTQEMDEITADFLAERKYQSPVSRIIVDGEFIFAFTATVNDSSEVLVDIFDGNSGKYLSSAFFPGSYNSQIRNGYFYQVNNYIQTDVFPKIEKYKIDPRVYGK